MSTLTLTRRGATTLLLTALLAACGGGGGDDDGLPPGVTGDLTAGGLPAAGNTAAGTALGSADAVFLFVGADAVAPLSAGARPLAIARASVQRLTERRATAAAADRRVDTLATETFVEPCTGGGNLTYVETFASAQTVTPGDTLSVTANSCVADGQTFTGSFLITVVSYAPTSTAVQASFTLNFNNFGSTLLRLNGSTAVNSAFTQTSDAVTLRFQGLTATFDGGTIEWRHTVAYSASTTQAPQVSFSGLVFAGNGFVLLTQVMPFTLNTVTGFPNGGILQLTGANGGRVRLIAGNTRFAYQFFAPGNSGGTPDATAVGRIYGS